MGVACGRPYQLEGLPDLPPIAEVIAELSKGCRTVQDLVDLLRSFRGCTEQVAMLGMMLLLYELEARLGSKWVREFLLILFLLSWCLEPTRPRPCGLCSPPARTSPYEGP